MLSVESQIHILLLKSITIKAWAYATEVGPSSEITMLYCIGDRLKISINCRRFAQMV
jgi:hypothetical protein